MEEWLGEPYGGAGAARLDEMEVTLGMIADEFIVEADCRQPMLKPMAGMLRKKHESVEFIQYYVAVRRKIFGCSSEELCSFYLA